MFVDMHCDTIYEILEAKKRGENASLRDGNFMVNLEKMKQSGSILQSFALYVEQEKGVRSFEKANQLLEVFREEMYSNKNSISHITSFDELSENQKAGKLSAFLTIEGGEACEGSIEKLRYFYQQGVRMMTLTWNFPNEIGFPNIRDEKRWKTPDREKGLTKFGVELVEEMEHLGMLVDVSHLSDAGFYDVLRVTKKPFVASHSNARSVCPHVRNLTDDMIAALADRGGVIGLNYHCKFLAEHYMTQQEKEQEVFPWLIRHIKHIVNIGGMECLGLGSDFDGIPAYPGMPTMETLDKLVITLQKNGFHERDVDRICHGNVLRVYREVL